MPLVNIMVNQRAYTIACDEGEEEHLRILGAHVDSKVRHLLESVGQVGESRLMLMAALLIADDYLDAEAQLEKRMKQVGDLSGTRDQMSSRLADAEGIAVAALETAAKRVEDIAARLGKA
jgi:cell division protein ZapA